MMLTTAVLPYEIDLISTNTIGKVDFFSWFLENQHCTRCETVVCCGKYWQQKVESYFFSNFGGI